MRRARRNLSVTREIGTALAVTAIWLLSLLAPLHQTSGLVRDLAARGFEPALVWSLCNPTDAAQDAGDDAKILCPAQGVAQSLLLLVWAVATGLLAAPRLWRFRTASRGRRSRAPPLRRTPQPRAPPLFS